MVSYSRVCFYEREMAERKRRGILAARMQYGEHQPPPRSRLLVVSSGLAHHVDKGHQRIISCLPSLTTCPHSTLWRTPDYNSGEANAGFMGVKINISLRKKTFSPVRIVLEDLSIRSSLLFVDVSLQLGSKIQSNLI